LDSFVIQESQEYSVEATTAPPPPPPPWWEQIPLWVWVLIGVGGAALIAGAVYYATRERGRAA